jgi:hypothetical protein
MGQNHSHSIVLSDRNALICMLNFFLHSAKNRLIDPSEICAVEFKGNFVAEPARFQRLSAPIGRFSASAGAGRRPSDDAKIPSGPLSDHVAAPNLLGRIDI